MKDMRKTKKELIRELEGLRRTKGRQNPKIISDKLNSPEEQLQNNIYKSFYDYSPLMCYTVDRAGTIVTVNPQATQHLGYSREELAGQPVLKAFHKDDRHKVSSRIKTCFKNPGRLYRQEMRNVRKDGRVVWVNVTSKALKDRGGSTLAAVICEDITECKNAEFLLGTKKEVFELIAGNAPLPEILNTLCLEIERQSEDMLCSFLLLDENGVNLSHGGGASLPKGYIKAVDGVEIGPSVGSCGTAAYLKKTVIVSDIANDPLWSDYKELALKYGLKSCWSTPIISSEKKVLGTFAMYYRDTRTPNPHELKVIETAAHLARLAIEKAHSRELAFRFGEILEESLNEIYIIDAESYKFLQANKRALVNLGYTLEELQEKTPLDVAPGLKLEEFLKGIKPLTTGRKKKANFTSSHRRKDGSVYPIEIYLKRSSLKGKKVFIANTLDVTNQNEKEQELQKNVEQLSKKSRYESIIRTITENVHQSLDLQEVFDNAVDALNKNVEGAKHVVIYMVEGTDAVLKANKGHADWYVKRVDRIPYPNGATWKTINEGKPRYVPDTDKDRVIGPAGKKFGTKSYLSMPIRSGKKTVGCIHIHSSEKDTFSKEDLGLLEIVARQLESAIKNAEQAEALRKSELDIKQKLNELSKKNRYEETINTVTRSVHSSIDLQEVMENAVDAMNKNIDGADNVSIYLVEGDEAVIKAHRGYPKWFIEGVERIPRPKGFTWDVIEKGELIYCPDVEKDNIIGPLGKKVGTKSYASMPVKHGADTIGCININSFSKNAYDKEELKLLEIIANQIEIAINNARQNDALRESEERYRTLYDQSPIGVYIFNKDLIITNTNDRHTVILKATREQIIGTKLRKIKDQTFIPLHEQALEGKSGSQEGFYRATVNSAELWLFVSIAPLRDGAGRIIGGMSVVEDITERKNAEMALRRSEENYESLVNTVESIVWKADPKTYAFTFISKRVERILGYPAEDWMKTENFWKDKIHPEDKDWVIEFCEKATRGKKDHVIEYRMVAADGRTVWLRDIVTVVVVKGKVTGLRGLMVDITDLKKAEDMLKESAERYRALIENVYDLIVELNADSKFLYLSPNFEEALGYRPEELMELRIFDYVHKDDTTHLIQEFERLVNERSSGEAVFRFKHKNGNWKWFESTGRTYETAAGDLRCVIVSRDITERKRLEEELFKKQNLESLGVLAGGIAHDFNNLLTSILGNVSISKMDLNPSDKIYGRLTEAENASLRARDLTTQLLTFSKGGAPVKEFVRSLGDLIVDTANFAASGSKVKCEFDIEDGIWPAEVDEGQISQVIHNLIINSDQAMPEGGKIHISLRNVILDDSNGFNATEGNFIRITIQDEGIGMTEELKKKIFDPYFTTKQRGSGLGLTTVYSIVKNHDGYITVNSEIGEGTRIDVFIPAADDREADEENIHNLLKGKGKILVMDDEKIVRTAAGEMIKHLGYNVDYASDGAEAIEKYVSAKKTGCPFDAVMVDLTVPGGMGGREANDRLLEIDPDVKTIVSSGYFNDPLMSQYSQFGFKGVITKPYKIEELSKTINSVLNGEH